MGDTSHTVARIQEKSQRIEQDLARVMTASDEAAGGLADPRFRAHHDDIAPGLAAWVRDAIVANADA